MKTGISRILVANNSTSFTFPIPSGYDAVGRRHQSPLKGPTDCNLCRSAALSDWKYKYLYRESTWETRQADSVSGGVHRERERERASSWLQDQHPRWFTGLTRFGYRRLNSCNFLHSPLTSFLSGPSVTNAILSSDTFSLLFPILSCLLLRIDCTTGLCK